MYETVPFGLTVAVPWEGPATIVTVLGSSVPSTSKIISQDPDGSGGASLHDGGVVNRHGITVDESLIRDDRQERRDDGRGRRRIGAHGRRPW